MSTGQASEWPSAPTPFAPTGVGQHGKRQAYAEHSHEQDVRGYHAANEIDITTAVVVTTRPILAIPKAVLSSMAARVSAAVGRASQAAGEASQYS